MMASASDIITYIGVPLAVLGVLPILYTFLLAIFTRRRIHALLVHHGHKPLSTSRHRDGFTIRSSPMTTLIEVELPRYTITPLERNSDEYWRTTDQHGHEGSEQEALLERAESTLSMVEEGRVRGYLRGGSWRAFHWRKLMVGKKLYRIQYEDELREPAAEVNFSDLIHFLLDWGAVPDTAGWEKLRSGGLWTPAGTVLLRKANAEDGNTKQHRDWVLRTTMPDESDGVLSLTIRWSKDLESVADARGAASLPPGWGRLSQPPFLQAADQEEDTRDRKDMPSRIESLKTANKYSMDSTSFRFHCSDNIVKQLHWESDKLTTGSISEPFLTQTSTSSDWFAAATASVLVQSSQANASPWSYVLPKEISNVTSKASIPCGILVILCILDEDATPQWNSKIESSYQQTPAQKFHHRHLARMEATKLEATMPPEQARIHRMNREAEERRQWHTDHMVQLGEMREKEERRQNDAIASPKMDNQAVAEACLAWLIQQGEVGQDWTLAQLAEATLYLIALDHREEGSEAKRIMEVLDEWHDWTTAGGLKRLQIAFLEQRKVEFCLAASLIAVIQKSEGMGHIKANTDMMECLRMWSKVRLG
jgi:hypothetical protein